MYANLKYCIKHPTDMSYSDFVDIHLVVKQGETLSPLIFYIIYQRYKRLS